MNNKIVFIRLILPVIFFSFCLQNVFSQQKPRSTAENWITYTNTTGAFSVKVPVQPQEIVKETPTKIQTKEVTFKINMYLATDTENSRAYIVRYNDYPPGTFLNDKQTLFNALTKDFATKGEIIGSATKIWKGEYEGREVKVILRGGFLTTIRIFARGKRVYMLLKEIIVPGAKDDNKKDIFFDSFQFIPYAEPDYYTYEPEKANFQLKMVSKPEIQPEKEKDYTSYLTNTILHFSTNPNSGGLYSFEYSKISPYFRIANLDSLYNLMPGLFVGEQDSLIKMDTVSVNGVKGRELLTINKEGTEKKRIRVIVDGDDFFLFSGHLDNTVLFDKTTNLVFNSLIIKKPSPRVDLSSSKAEKLCHDLESADTLISNTAKGALSFYDFTKDELPYVYSALKKNYRDDSLLNGTRALLVNKLKKIYNDSTLNVLSNLYRNLDGKDNLKALVLNTIPFVDKKRGYDVYFELFITNPPLTTEQPSKIFAPLNDSIAFAAGHFAKLLPFIKTENYRTYILRIAKNIVNQKNETYRRTIKDNYLPIFAYAEADIDNYVKLKDSDKNDYSARIFNYMQLIGKIKPDALNDRLTKQYLTKDPKGLYAPDAVVARIYNHLPNNPLSVSKFLDSIGTRYDLMEAYNEVKQLDKVPLKYRKLDEYAKLCLYQTILSDDYGIPTKITLLGNILKNGSVYYVFKFLVPDKAENTELIGITGPYKIGSTKLNFERYYAYTDYDVVKTNWRLQAAKMIQPLLDAYK